MEGFVGQRQLTKTAQYWVLRFRIESRESAHRQAFDDQLQPHEFFVNDVASDEFVEQLTKRRVDRQRPLDVSDSKIVRERANVPRFLACLICCEFLCPRVKK